ncbi:hypothetical protein [Flavobacterium phycosphaerae]|uniref:hypothetical protein n=1 Tax=Flavobacterium phycosphaerae TaxID=2697515 RepID=UPI0013897DEA|nr:hypothetical protein [Flavobacterium phycosphaerae]
MNAFFHDHIAKSNAGTLSRNTLRFFVVKNPEYMSELAAIATDLSNKNHHKAIWIIEMLVEDHPEMLVPYLDRIIETIPKYKHESAIRGMSRVAYFLSISKVISLTENQKEKLIEICLDWLIGNAKVAPKAYAMYTLCHYAQKEDWIKEELRNIINKDFHHQSAGYKAAAKEVLRKIDH